MVTLYVYSYVKFSAEVEARSGGPRSGELPEARRRQREGASGVRGESSLRSFWASHTRAGSLLRPRGLPELEGVGLERRVAACEPRKL